jgi:hypothetical protein
VDRGDDPPKVLVIGGEHRHVTDLDARLDAHEIDRV